MPLSDPPSTANGFKLSGDYWLDYLAYAVLRRPRDDRRTAVATVARLVTVWGNHGFTSAAALDLLEARVREVHAYERQRRGGAVVQQHA